MSGLTFSLALIALFLATGALLAVAILWHRARQANVRQNGLFEELAALTLFNKNLINRIQKLEKRAAVAPSVITQTAVTQAQKPEPLPNKSKEAPEETKSLWKDVIFLAKQGLSADTIARDLHITRGEVELILGLHNFKPKE
jgi:hypothetical protein